MDIYRVGLSTASLCLWGIDPLEKLRICKSLKFSRIEIGLGTFKMLKEFVNLNLYDLNFYDEIKAFQYITINVPWCHINYGRNNKTKTVVKYLNQLNDNLNIEAFVFRVDCISDFSFLDSVPFNFYLENSVKPGSWLKICDVLKNSDYKLVLDLNRATRNENYIDKMLNEFEDRIAEIQVNGFIDGYYRVPILISGQHYLLDKVKYMNVPFIIEGLFPPGDYLSIHKERQIITDKLSLSSLQEYQEKIS